MSNYTEDERINAYVETMNNAIVVLRSERDSLKFDAERYRWFRENYLLLLGAKGPRESSLTFHQFILQQPAELRPGIIDAAIDGMKGDQK